MQICIYNKINKGYGGREAMEKSIGERLKELVKEKGLEQQEAANQMNIKVPTFNGYVSNKREPSIDRLKQLAEYFNVSVDYLVGYSEIRDPYLSYLSEEVRNFVMDPVNEPYIELAMDIKKRTANPGIKQYNIKK